MKATEFAANRFDGLDLTDTNNAPSETTATDPEMETQNTMPDQLSALDEAAGLAHDETQNPDAELEAAQDAMLANTAAIEGEGAETPLTDEEAANAEAWDNGPEANRPIDPETVSDVNADVAPAVEVVAVAAKGKSKGKAKSVPLTLDALTKADAEAKADAKAEPAKAVKAKAAPRPTVVVKTAEEKAEEKAAKEKIKAEKDARDKAFGGDPNYTIQPIYGDSRDKTGYVNALGLTSTEKHQHVAERWQDNCIPMPQFRQAIGEAGELKRDATGTPLSAIRLKQNGQGYVTMADGRRFTNFGMESAWQFAGLKQATLKDLKDPVWKGEFNPTIVQMFNSAMDKMTNAEKKDAIVRYRTIPGEKGNYEAVRAIRPSGFVVIDNETALSAVLNAIPEEGREFVLASHISHDGDNLILNMLLPDMVKGRPDSPYGVGLSLSNSEVGLSPVRVEPYLFRAICWNGCIWGRRDATAEEGVVVQKHSGVLDFNEFQRQLNTAVLAALTEGKSLLNQFDLAREVQVKNVEASIMYLSEENGLSSNMGRAWYNAYETMMVEEGAEVAGKGTMFGIVNALTAAAQGEDYIGFPRHMMEKTAGQILSENLKLGIDAMKDRAGKLDFYANSIPATRVDRYLYGKVQETTDAPNLTSKDVQLVTNG